jgi:RNA polymerase sigma-70 factor (ECF subfamily)
MSDFAKLSDEELLRRACAGAEAAFVTLYRRRQASVYRFALRMCGSESVAEDVTQEVFLILLREAARYDAERSSLTTYLFGIARNQVLRRLERERSFAPLLVEEDEQPLHAALVTEQNPLGDLTRQELIGAVRQAVLALPPHYREVVVLCDLHELSYQEAAQTLGLAIGTVRSRLHRARGLLVEKLRAYQAPAKSARAQTELNVLYELPAIFPNRS